MYLKIRCREKDEDNDGLVTRWFIIGKILEISWKWVTREDFPNPMYDNARMIESYASTEPYIVRRIIAMRGKNIKDSTTEVIYCDDQAYLCNDNGQTIEVL